MTTMSGNAHGRSRVLLVGSSTEHGGAERRFFNLSRYLFGGSIDACVFKESASASLNFRNKPILLRWKSEWSYPRMALQLRKIISEKKYHIIFSLGRFPNLLVWAATRFLRDKPMLIFSEITRPWTELSKSPVCARRELLKFLVKKTYHKADLFLCNSVDGIEESVKYFGIKRESAKRVPNIIDFESLMCLAREECKFLWPNQKNVIVAVSRLDRFKRIDVLLKAFSCLPHELDCALIIAGNGPEESTLRQLADRLKIHERVHFLGWVENPYPILRRAKLFVLSSEYEGFSNSVLEAMFLETPVITSYCSSDARDMCNKGAAVGFDLEKPNELTHSIINILVSPEKQRHLIRNAKAYCGHHELNEAITFYEQSIMRLYERNI